MSVEDTLAEREKQHGDFNQHCNIESELRKLLEHYGTDLDVVQYVGLGMIMHKMARVLNHGHNHIDSWHDIAGYATLVERHMNTRTVYTSDGGKSGV